MSRGFWPWPVRHVKGAVLAVGMLLMCTGPASASGGFGLPRLTCVPCDEVAASAQAFGVEQPGSLKLRAMSLKLRAMSLKRGSAGPGDGPPALAKRRERREPGPPMTPLGWPVGMGMWGLQAGSVLGVGGFMTRTFPPALAMAAPPALGIVGFSAGLLVAHAPTEVQRRVHYAGLAFAPGTLLATLGGGFVEQVVMGRTGMVFGHPASATGFLLGGAVASLAGAALIPTSVPMTRASLWAADLTFAMVWGEVGFWTGFFVSALILHGSGGDPRERLTLGLVGGGLGATLAASLAPLVIHTLTPPEHLLTPERIAASQWATFAVFCASAFIPYGLGMPLVALGILGAPAVFTGALWLSTLMPTERALGIGGPSTALSMGTTTTVRDKSGQPVTLAPVFAFSF